MEINYTEKRDFTKEQLEELFLSVNWLSGKYPEKLLQGLKNCETVFTAWHGDKLVGLANALDDGALTAYVHYLLVHPNYQKKGISKELINKIKEKYADYFYLFLVAENEPLIEYYEKFNFKKIEGTSVMAIQNP